MKASILYGSAKATLKGITQFFVFIFADEFRSKVGCENDVLHLSCNPHSRVAIYSAQYGRTEYDSIQCPQPRGMKEESK